MKQPQTLGIEYEITDLPTGADADAEPRGPARPERFVDEELAHLSGGLFDNLPPARVPLDSFFPPAPADLRPPRAPTFDLPPLPPPGSPVVPPAIGRRADSLYPTTADVPPLPPITARGPAFPWGQTVLASVAGVVLAVALMRPSPDAAAPAAAPPPGATIPAAAPSPEPAPVEAVTATDAARVKTSTTSVLAAPAHAAPRAAAAPAPHPAEPRPQSAAAAAPVAPVQAAPVDAAPVQELGSSPTSTADALHRANIDPPGLPPQRAAIAIAAAARGAGSCLDPDDLRRTMAVSVTFSPAGHATRATVDGGPHRGTAAGSCIAQRLRTAVVQPFERSPVTIHTSITAR